MADPHRFSTFVSWETILGTTQPPPHPDPYQVFPAAGRLYLSGLRAMHETDDLLITIRHPVTKDPLGGIERVPACALNPYHRASALFRGRGGDVRLDHQGDLWLWTSALHDPENLEPMYCEAGLPLIIEAEGDAFLQLSFWGSDHYRVYAVEDGCPQTTGELRSPFDPQKTLLAPAMGVAPHKLN